MQADHGRWVQIGQVKEKISSEKGWEASLQKLIYSGMYRFFRSIVVLIMSPVNRQDLARCKHR